MINQWSCFYEKITLSNQGKILVEDSKGTCPISGADCISVVKHGQEAEPSKQNVKNAKELLSNQINPLVDIVELKKSLEEEDSICE
ncbi:PAAR-like protein [Flavobacterium sp. HTF]|uniref:PAAR-like protein n=1 Tax=Flavobacterium sp. HTF TaxID=2170732 RepID=UPI0029374215|nr:PAAR-like protein [Flavobacterium sp. HTF]